MAGGHIRGRPVDFARAQGLLRFAGVALAGHGHLQAAPPVVSRAAARQ